MMTRTLNPSKDFLALANLLNDVAKGRFRSIHY